MHNIKISKKGFTLIELLAVITVLSIVMILTLTTGGNIFDASKKQAFVAETKNVYKSAIDQFSKDSLFEKRERIYAKNKNEQCEERLLANENNEINYFVKFDINGNITEFYTTDDNYSYSFKNSSFLKINDIKPSDITTSKNIAITCDNTYEIDDNKFTGVIYITSGYEGYATIGSSIKEPTIGEYSTNIEDDTMYTDFGYYLKHEVINDIITKSFVCVEVNHQNSCFRGGDNLASYQRNLDELHKISSAFIEADGTCSFGDDFSRCKLSKNPYTYVSLYSNGEVFVGWSNSHQWSDCNISSSGQSQCNY